MIYRVYAFYIKQAETVTVKDSDDLQEIYEYLRDLRAAGTPYAALREGGLIDKTTSDSVNEDDMARMIYEKWKMQGVGLHG